MPFVPISAAHATPMPHRREMGRQCRPICSGPISRSGREVAPPNAPDSSEDLRILLVGSILLVTNIEVENHLLDFHVGFRECTQCIQVTTGPEDVKCRPGTLLPLTSLGTVSKTPLWKLDRLCSCKITIGPFILIKPGLSD